MFEHPAPVSAARVFVATVLTEWRNADAVFDAQLIVSELITNAMRHGGGAQSLSLVVRGAHVGCSVSDYNHLPPVAAAEADHFAEFGRGLHLIQALSLCWGWYQSTPGKRVWAVLR
ncbi:ATP-binding protein [Nonomuraea sp. NPDC050310]|uniref:ATP-binding protein n=1 Tax=unclassified Nonomuraea TaxID=2593643 RepID=UPI0033EA3B2A